MKTREQLYIVKKNIQVILKVFWETDGVLFQYSYQHQVIQYHRQLLRTPYAQYCNDLMPETITKWWETGRIIGSTNTHKL